MRETLFLAHRLPWPPDRGDKIRSWHLLQALARIAPVHLACLAEDDSEMAGAGAVTALTASQCIAPRTNSRGLSAAKALLHSQPLSLPLFDSPVIRAHVAKLLVERDIGCVFAFSAQMAQFVPALPGKVRFVMDFVDVDSAKFADYAKCANPLMRAVYAREAKRLFAFEQETAARADASLFVSEAEASLFRRLTGLGADKVQALENGTDLAFFDPAADFQPVVHDGPLIVFTGQMDYRPNVEAVTRFARETLPLVRAALPGARFAIVGRSPDPSVRTLAALPGVTVTGEVADVRGWLAAATLVVAPLGIARGVQNKVLEAMAMGRPVIASPAAFEGIAAEAGRDLIVVEGAHAEARAIVTLLADRDAARRIGKAARVRIEAHYGWDVRLAALPEIVGVGAPPRMDAAA